MKFRLVRVANGTALRTPEVIGTADRLPAVGKRFVLICKPLEAGDERRVITSRVQEWWETEGTIVFKTENSTYRLQEIIDA